MKDFVYISPSRLKGLLALVLICAVSFAETPSKGPKFEGEVEVKPSPLLEKEVILGMGVSKTLDFAFEVGPIYITDPSLFSYVRVPEQGKLTRLRLVPKAPGFTDMTIHDGNQTPKIKYLVRVTKDDVAQVISQLESLVGDIEGLKIKPIGGNIILDGEILLPKDMIRIIRVIDAVKNDPKRDVNIRNLATISKITMNILAERIEREVGSPEITVRVVNNNMFLEGTAESEFEADRALEIAKNYLPEVTVEKTQGEGISVKPKEFGGYGGGLPAIVDLLRVRRAPAPPPGQDVQVTMNYVELSNDYSRTFNFQWQPLVSDQSSVKYDTSLGELSANALAIVSSLLPKLNQARDHGHAKILRQQSVIVKDKSTVPAAIESSVTYYSRVLDQNGNASFQPIPVQNVTRVRASVLDGTDSVELGLQVTLGTVLGINGGAPIISSNSLQTQVTVKSGDSAAIGGDAIDQALAGYNRDPVAQGGGGAPQGGSGPLFNLTRSKSIRRDKKQYVIFVTPTILRNAGAGTEDITRKFRLNAGER